MKEKGKKFFKTLIGMMLALTCGLSAVQSAAIAVQAEDAAEPPKFEKTLTSNGDGTYTVSLSVTGTAASSEETTKVNVIVVLDVSGSMDFNVASPTGRYGSNDDGENVFRLYGRSGNDYSEIRDGFVGTVYYYDTWRGRYIEYTGTRFSTETRMDVAKKATKTLAATLLSQNKDTAGRKDMIELELITFSGNASKALDWISGTSTSGFDTTVDGLNANGGTNWDDALYLARGDAAAKTDKGSTYIIFVSDGNPTFYVGSRIPVHTVTAVTTVGRETASTQLIMN